MEKSFSMRGIVVVATSLGGPQALKAILAGLPSDFPASMFIVMHIGTWPSRLPELLAADSRIPVVHGSHGEAIAAGTVYVAPPDRHMLVVDDKQDYRPHPRKTSRVRPLTRSFVRPRSVMGTAR